MLPQDDAPASSLGLVHSRLFHSLVTAGVGSGNNTQIARLRAY